MHLNQERAIALGLRIAKYRRALKAHNILAFLRRSITAAVTVACLGATVTPSWADGVIRCTSSAPAHARKTYEVSGTIANATSGVTIQLFDQAGAVRISGTRRDGKFSIDGLTQGTYRIVPSQEGFDFSPLELEISVANCDITGLRFTRDTQTEDLDPETLALLDSVAPPPTPPEGFILPNGMNLVEYAQMRGISLEFVDEEASLLRSETTALATEAATPPSGPQEARNDAIAGMMARALDLSCGRKDTGRCTKYDYPVGAGENEPAQSGLTYVYGSGNHTVRTKPLDNCPEKTHGLDCSGMMRRVARAGGLSAPSGSASTFSDPAKWGVPEGLKLEVVTDGSTEPGDIVVFSSHVGIAYGSSTLISATGRKNECLPNITPPRGPRSAPMSYFGPRKATLRLVAPVSGDWQMNVRCAGIAQVVATLQFTLNNDTGGPFSVPGAGTDIGGGPLSFVLSGDYDQLNNILSAQLNCTNCGRIDAFSEKLVTDTIGYFPLTKVVDNGGCPGEALLQRLPLGDSSAEASESPTINRTETPSVRFGGP